MWGIGSYNKVMLAWIYTLSTYRGLYLIKWTWMILSSSESEPSFPIKAISGLLQTILYLAFFIRLWTSHPSSRGYLEMDGKAKARISSNQNNSSSSTLVEQEESQEEDFQTHIFGLNVDDERGPEPLDSPSDRV